MNTKKVALFTRFTLTVRHSRFHLIALNWLLEVPLAGFVTNIGVKLAPCFLSPSPYQPVAKSSAGFPMSYATEAVTGYNAGTWNARLVNEIPTSLVKTYPFLQLTMR